MAGPVLWGPNNTSNNLQANLSQTGKYSGAGANLPWTTAISYAVNDVVTYEKYSYICLVAHTASSTIEVDVASGYWQTLNLPQVGRNYMIVGNNFEDNDLGGWQLFNISGYSAGTVPSSAPTLGSATGMTVATTGTNPLSGKYSLQVSNTASTNMAAGSGIISQAYNIDIIDQAKMLQIKFAYQATTGNTLQNYSGTSSNTWAIYIYDVTNSAWIQPAGVYNLVQNTSSLVGTASATFQTPSNMTQFRIALLCINPTTGSTPAVNTIQTTFDDFYIGPQPFSSGAAMSDWVAYTPTFTGFGSVSSSGIYSRRVGDSIEVQGWFQAGTVTATTAAITLGYNGSNANISIDTNKIAAGTSIGSGSSNTSPSTTYFGHLSVLSTSGNTVNFGVQTSTTAANSAATANTIIGSSAILSFYFKAPIVGWSSSTVQSADTDTRVVAAFLNTTVQTVITSTPTAVPLTAQNDTHGAWSGSTYTVPVSGYYDIAASALVLGTYAAGQGVTIEIYKSGSTIANVINNAAASSSLIYISQPISVKSVYCKAGDTLQLYLSCNATGTVKLNGAANQNFLSISRVSGPAVVQATESVYWRGGTSSSQSITSSFTQVTTGWSSIKDTHNAFNTSTGVYTVPVSGMYKITGQLYFGTSASSTNFIAVISTNGLPPSSGPYGIRTASSSTLNLSTAFSDLVYCDAGTQISIWGYAGVTTALISSSRDNRWSIQRIGN